MSASIATEEPASSIWRRVAGRTGRGTRWREDACSQSLRFRDVLLVAFARGLAFAQYWSAPPRCNTIRRRVVLHAPETLYVAWVRRMSGHPGTGGPIFATMRSIFPCAHREPALWLTLGASVALSAFPVVSFTIWWPMTNPFLSAVRPSQHRAG